MWYGKDMKETDQTVPQETLFLIKAINPLQSHFTMTKKKKKKRNIHLLKMWKFSSHETALKQYQNLLTLFPFTIKIDC